MKVKDDLKLSYHNARALNGVIDKQLPPGRPRFRCREIVVAGEAFDIYYRDALECVKALFGDSNFSADLVFRPERHYTDANMINREFHDMEVGKWWWDIQVSACPCFRVHWQSPEFANVSQKAVDTDAGPGGTIVPVIISSDKTRLTKFKGKDAYPVYLTIGNLPKEIRRKVSHQGQILLAYLPTTKLEHIKNKSARRRTAANLYHSCMNKILEPLQEPGRVGVEMSSGDGAVRRCHTIFAAHVGDYPEQVCCSLRLSVFVVAHVNASMTGACHLHQNWPVSLLPSTF